jgi:hypothetical protein
MWRSCSAQKVRKKLITFLSLLLHHIYYLCGLSTNQAVLSGLPSFWTLAILQYSKEHVLEIGSVSILGEIWETPTLLGILDKANLNHCPTYVNVKVKVRVTLWLVVYRQSVPLGIKPLETQDQRFFFQLSPCSNSPYVLSDEKMVCFLWICLAFRQVYISHI